MQHERRNTHLAQRRPAAAKLVDRIHLPQPQPHQAGSQHAVHTCTGNLPHPLRDRTSAALKPHACACWDRTPPACCTRARVAEWSARVHSARAQFLTDSALRFASTHCTSAPMPPVSAIACLVSGWTCSVHCQPVAHCTHACTRRSTQARARARTHKCGAVGRTDSHRSVAAASSATARSAEPSSATTAATADGSSA